MASLYYSQDVQWLLNQQKMSAMDLTICINPREGLCNKPKMYCKYFANMIYWFIAQPCSRVYADGQIHRTHFLLILKTTGHLDLNIIMPYFPCTFCDLLLMN